MNETRDLDDWHNTIWLYWENRPNTKPPPHVLLCKFILRRVCRGCTIRMVTPKNVRQYLPDFDNRLTRIVVKNRPGTEIAVRSDFIRAFVLERYGGVYVDTDCIALRDFSEICDRLRDHEFVAMRRTSVESQHISVGLYGTVPHGKIITEYADALRDLVSRKTRLNYVQAGQALLTPFVDAHLGDVYLYPEELLHPIPAQRQSEFASEATRVADVISPETISVMLFHRMFETGFAGQSLRNLYRGPTLLSQLFRSVLPEEGFEELEQDLARNGARAMMAR